MTELKSPDFWPQATLELAAIDPVMAEIIGNYTGEAMQTRGDAFQTLARSIVGQQISVKAADAIWQRVDKGVGGFAIERMIGLSAEQFREFGLTRQKSGYFVDLTRFFHERQHLERDWSAMSDAEVVKDLTQIKGIGKWTAEMFMMFHLHRPDVLPLGDLALVKAIQNHYNHGAPMSVPEMTTLAERWRPWRSVATWYLWRTFDPVAMNY